MNESSFRRIVKYDTPRGNKFDLLLDDDQAAMMTSLFFEPTNNRATNTNGKGGKGARRQQSTDLPDLLSQGNRLALAPPLGRGRARRWEDESD